MAAVSVPTRNQQFILTATAQTLTLREQAAAVSQVLANGALTATTFTGIIGGVTSATGTGVFAQFTGTAESPATTLGLGPGYEPGFFVSVEYVPVSVLPTDE